MSDSMKKSTFRSLWKLCFCLSDDEDCQRNQLINRKAMEFLFDSTSGILDFMKSDPMFARTSADDTCVMQLCILMAHHPQIYGVLSEDTKLQISALTNRNYTADIISWFTSSNKANHMKRMIGAPYYGKLSEKTICFVSDQYKLSGDLPCFIDYCIEYFGRSASYDMSNERFIVRLINVVNKNDQIYNRNSNYITNTEIAMAAYRLLGVGFDFEEYPNFVFDREQIENEKNGKSCETELESEPF